MNDVEERSAQVEDPAVDGGDGAPRRFLHRFDRRFWLAIIGICVLALGVRMANVFVWRPTTVGCDLVASPTGPTGDGGCYETKGDALYHLVQAEGIARGDWYLSSVHYYFFGEERPGAGDPPLYAAFLGLVSALGGTGGTAGRVVGLVVVAGLVAAGVLVARWRAGARGARIALAIGLTFAAALVLASTVPVHRIPSAGVSDVVLPAVDGKEVTGPGFDLLDGTSHRAASALLGVAGVALLGILAGRLAGARAGLVAAAIAAVYPMLWINDAMVLSESLYVPLLAVAMLSGIELWRSPTLGRAAVCGLACALAALARAEASLLLVAMVPSIALGARWSGARQRLGMVAVAFGVALLAVAPWLAFNLTRFEEPALMTSQTWAVFSAGSCDTAFGLSEGARFIGYYGANCYGELVEAGLAEWPSIDLDESQRDVQTKDATLAYLGDHLDRLPTVMAARVGRMWDVFRPGQNAYLNWSIEGRGRTASWIGLAMWFPLLVAAVAGTVILRRRRRPVSPFVGMAVIVTVTAAITFGTTRYRVPVDAGIVVLAAVTIDACLRRWHVGWFAPVREDEADAAT